MDAPDPQSGTQPEDVVETPEGEIRQRAYLLWEADGKPDGRHEQYWHRARELILDEGQSAYPPSQSRGNRT